MGFYPLCKVKLQKRFLFEQSIFVFFSHPIIKLRKISRKYGEKQICLRNYFIILIFFHKNLFTS